MTRLFDEMRLYIDYAVCIGCETCEATCRFLYTLPRIHMVRTTEGIMAPLYCQHCASPKCATACEQDALVQDDDGALLLKPLRCVGCRSKECITACPYGAIFLFKGPDAPVVKCDLCARRRVQGMGPACVETCPCAAISLVHRNDVGKLKNRAATEALRRVLKHISPPLATCGGPSQEAE
ncbi:4Fe-4S dicluster domain-containing protein [Desulfonatronum thioautotrophicum]|uniref:4Fe-4S dicluster domain-containing protein n=1 Tax=Desulfonatronum thioautotrophicum TaxID=617001 RepID=UPI0005EB6E5D|nr:4Fe-4S dicluster domain-containing protein [Desulfonatronum thioautotrophicum]